MNIFYLDPNPAIAASFHCDQHLHKMILESAQILSTVAHSKGFDRHGFYKPTHQNHPCVVWAGAKTENADWVVELMYGLDQVRVEELGADSHSSMRIAALYDQLLPGSGFAYAKPIYVGAISVNANSVPEQYQALYRYKAQQWKLQGREMTWKNRTVPTWMGNI